jgi:hypothetical protein
VDAYLLYLGRYTKVLRDEAADYFDRHWPEDEKAKVRE